MKRAIFFDEFGGGIERGTPDSALSDEGEEAFDLVDPGVVGSSIRKCNTVRDGRNPRQERIEITAARALTVAELCDRYLEAAHAGLVNTRFGRPTATDGRGRRKAHYRSALNASSSPIGGAG